MATPATARSPATPARAQARGLASQRSLVVVVDRRSSTWPSVSSLRSRAAALTP
jgi:hypothetical protein